VRLVTDTLFPMADLAARWGVTPNTVSRRLAFLQIKPIRQGNYRFLTVEQLELANALHSHVLSGQPMETFPHSQQEGEAMAIARRQTVKVDIETVGASDFSTTVLMDNCSENRHSVNSSANR
jgi:hypothetical protein